MAMASNKRTVQLATDVNAASGITAGQKAAISKVIDIIDTYPNGGAQNHDMDRIYQILRAAF